MVHYKYVLANGRSLGTFIEIMDSIAEHKADLGIQMEKISNKSDITKMFAHGALVERSDDSIQLEEYLLDQFEYAVKAISKFECPIVMLWQGHDQFNTIKVLPAWDVPFYVMSKWLGKGGVMAVEAIEE